MAALYANKLNVQVLYFEIDKGDVHVCYAGVDTSAFVNISLGGIK